MTKLSCKIGDFASSVVVLKDGRAMEVRRGKETCFAGAVKRTFWPTVDDWKATLPEGGVAAIKEEGRPTPVDKWATTNPVLARVIERARVVRGDRLQTSNCVCVGTLEGRILQEISRYECIINPTTGYPKETVALYCYSMDKAKKRLADLLATGKGDEKLYSPTTATPRLFTLTDSGEMKAVYYNIRENAIVTRTTVLEEGHYIPTGKWTPITNPEAPMWFMACPSNMIKI